MKQILVDASQEESIDLNKNKDIAILALKAFWSKPRPYIHTFIKYCQNYQDLSYKFFLHQPNIFI